MRCEVRSRRWRSGRKGWTPCGGSCEAAEAAQREAEALRLAIAHVEAQSDVQAARSALDELPDSLAHVRPDDAETLETWRARVEEAREKRSSAEREGAELEEQLSRNLVVRAGRPASRLGELEQHLEKLRENQNVLERRREAAAHARETAKRAWEQIEGAVDADRAAAADVATIGSVDGIAEKALRLEGQVRVLEALDRAVERLRAQGGARTDADRLAEGVRHLRTWLRMGEPAAPALPRHVAIGAAAACGVLAVALGAFVHPVAFALLAAAVGFGFLAWRLANASSGRDGRAEARRGYERLGIGSPEWTDEGVEAQLGELEREQASRAYDEEAERQLAARRPTSDTVSTLHADVEKARARLETALGVDVRTKPVRAMYVVRSVQDWQRMRREALGIEAEIEEVEARIADCLGRTCALLSPFDVPAVDDVAALAATVATLRDAYDACAAADRNLQDAMQRREAAETTIAEVEADIAALFGRIGLDASGGDEAVRAACADRERFVEQDRAVTQAEARLEAACERLRAHEAFEPSMETLSESEARQRLDDAALRAAEQGTLLEQIHKLEEQVQQTRQGRALEEAESRHRAALDALREKRDAAAAACVGQLIADQAEHVAREEQVPHVLKRARDLFAAITTDRYHLAVGDGGFVARDTVKERSFQLDELSSGTRVQLLLSVRMAFIEEHELGVRLPLVLDEVLANSDDERARAIVEAVLHLCREGRQVFYFTAQADEVAKWQRLTEEAGDVDCQLVSLDGVRREADTEALPAAVKEAPAPEGRSHAEYGVVLDVSAWDGWRPVGELDLWYVISCPDTLYAMRRAGVNRLGQLLSAARRDAARLVGADEATVARSRVFADALRAWQEAWREGRGLRVDRDTLEACGAVSDTFIDRRRGLQCVGRRRRPGPRGRTSERRGQAVPFEAGRRTRSLPPGARLYRRCRPAERGRRLGPGGREDQRRVHGGCSQPQRRSHLHRSRGRRTSNGSLTGPPPV